MQSSWDIKTQFVPHRRCLRYRAQPVNAMLHSIEVFTAVTMKNADFCDVTPCGSCKN
jgi:hypothetical protein